MSDPTTASEWNRPPATSQPPSPPSSRSRRAALTLAALGITFAFVAGLVIGQSGLLTAPSGAPSPSALAVSPGPMSTATPSVSAPASPADPGHTAGPEITPAPVASPEPLPSPPPGAPADFALFWQAYELIRQNFVGRDGLAELPLTHGAIRGLVEALGDTGHSVFLTPEAVRRADESISGTFVGIGVVLGEREGRTVIMSVISGGPASAAGLRSGDMILEVDGDNVERLGPAEIAPIVRGEPGTEVTLRVFRQSTGETFDLTLLRAEIRLPAAEWAMVPGTRIALLRFNQFSQRGAAELRQARDMAISQGAQALILDLRSNPGGLVHEAVEAASLFIGPGRTVYIRELADGQRIPVPAQAGVVATELPLVVLIDEGTASSAEIMAGAIRSAGRGELVGTTSFGTGTVLITYPLDDGSAIRIAVERWLTPDGELIFERGIEPTVPVELDLAVLPFSPDELRELDPAGLREIADSQLLRAIELLGGLDD